MILTTSGIFHQPVQHSNTAKQYPYQVELVVLASASARVLTYPLHLAYDRRISAKILTVRLKERYLKPAWQSSGWDGVIHCRNIISSSLTQSSKIVLVVSLCKTEQKTRTVSENEVSTLLHVLQVYWHFALDSIFFFLFRLTSNMPEQAIEGLRLIVLITVSILIEQRNPAAHVQ